jgi:hypothetical protein
MATIAKDFDSPYTEPLDVPPETEKPSQAEGERKQPGDGERDEQGEGAFAPPEKPSQAEGERKPYQ